MDDDLLITDMDAYRRGMAQSMARARREEDEAQAERLARQAAEWEEHRAKRAKRKRKV